MLMTSAIPAAILCGGEGRRLAGLLGDQPKALASVSGRPFLEHLINFLRAEGLQKIHLLTGVHGEKIENFLDARPEPWRRQIVTRREREPLGTGGSAAACLASLQSEALLVINGDTLFDFPLREFLACAWEKIQRRDASAVISLAHASGHRFGRVRFSEGKVLGFFAPGRGEESSLAEAGFALLHASAFSCSTQAPFSLSGDIYPKLAASGRLAGVVYDRAFLDYGVPEDFSRMEEFFRETAWAGNR